MLETVKWLFFDMGSTLINEERAYAHRLRDIATRAHVPCAQVEAAARRFCRQNKKGDLEAANAFHVSLPPWHQEDETLYADVPECLAQLRQAYHLGVIANQPPGTAERLRQYGIFQYFDCIAASGEDGFSKPDERLFQIALERSRCKPVQAVMIGDRVDNDIVPAKALGMYTIWLRQGFWRDWSVNGAAEQADGVIEHFSQLCDIFL